MSGYLRNAVAALVVAFFATGDVSAQTNPTSDPGSQQTAQEPAAKAKSKPKKKEPFVKFTGSFGLHCIYDDNILRMSDNTLLSFRMNDNPDKFHLETYDDLIVSPRLGLTFAKKLLGGKETSVRLGYLGWRYAENRIKNNESWAVRLRQGTMGRDFIEASYTYAPPSYIKHLSDRPPYTPRTVPLVWIPFKLRRNAFLLGYSKRVTDKLSARVDVGRTLRFYNRPFLENDNWEWNGAAFASYTLSKTFKLSGEYTYSDAETRSYDSVTESFEMSDDSDGSYERDMYQVTLDISTRNRIWKKLSGVSLMGQYQNYFFTSERTPIEDQLHVGRKDEVVATEIEVATKPLYGSMSLVTGWRFSKRTTSLPASVSEEDAEDKAYEDNRVWLGMSYPF